MTIKEASQQLGKSETTLRRWIQTGKIRGELIEGRYDIPPTETRCLANDLEIETNRLYLLSLAIDQLYAS